MVEEYFVVLDDDPLVHRLLEAAIGKKCRAFSSSKEAIGSANELEPIGVFVDIHLGVDDNGLDILPKLKQSWPFCPILVMTADKDDDLIGQALASGADDFVRKPINPKEVLARLQARLDELSKREAKELLKVADITIDTSHRLISNDSGKKRYLSPTEMTLLTCLLNAHGTVVKREVIKRKCWGQIYVSDNALNRKLHEVRRILKEVSPSLNIKTVYGMGFVLEVKQSPTKVA
jgi:DNA-binding response OmpR family regulator